MAIQVELNNWDSWPQRTNHVLHFWNWYNCHVLGSIFFFFYLPYLIFLHYCLTFEVSHFFMQLLKVSFLYKYCHRQCIVYGIHTWFFETIKIVQNQVFTCDFSNIERVFLFYFCLSLVIFLYHYSFTLTHKYRRLGIRTSNRVDIKWIVLLPFFSPLFQPPPSQSSSPPPPPRCTTLSNIHCFCAFDTSSVLPTLIS